MDAAVVAIVTLDAAVGVDVTMSSFGSVVVFVVVVVVVMLVSL